MTARTRTTITIALVALAAMLGACDAGPVVSPGPSVGTQGQVVPAPTPEDIAAATAALDGLDSYRFTATVTEGAGGTARSQGTVVNGDVRRTRIEYTADGAFAGGTITIGGRTWISVAGAAYREQEGAALGANDWVNPVAGQLDPYSLGLTVVEDLGVEDHGGVQARHLRATARAGDVVDDDGLPIGIGFTGVVDAWIAVDGGYLVATRAEGTEALPSGDAAEPPASPTPYAFEVAVDGVGDAANVIEEPVATTTTPEPTGDPAALRLIRGIAEGQSSLDSYVYTITSSTAGFDLTSRLTVVNRPSPAARLETDAVAGFEGMTILVIGDRSWSRTGAGSWQPGQAGSEPVCGSGADPMSETARCTLARLTGTGATIREMRNTFLVVATDVEVRGITVTHLRSESGVRQGVDVLPGTRDIWIANDGGYLVKDVFTGLGISSSSVIGRIDDPGNVLEVPAP